MIDKNNKLIVPEYVHDFVGWLNNRGVSDEVRVLLGIELAEIDATEEEVAELVDYIKKHPKVRGNDLALKLLEIGVLKEDDDQNGYLD